MEYFGPWDDPDRALALYEHWLATGSKVIVASPALRAKPVKGAPPKKPYKDFPLYAHSNGQWAKKVRQKTLNFGTWDNPQAALDKWLAEKDDLLAGRVPRVAVNGLTVAGLVNDCLRCYSDRLNIAKNIKPRTFNDLERIGKRIVAVFGRGRLVADLGPDDFWKLQMDFASTHGPVKLTDDMTRAKTIFRYAAKNFDVHVRYGSKFDKPTKAQIREAKNAKPKKFFEAAEIQTLLASASAQMKAMILLGVNCGFGNSDCANLELKHLDLEGGWHNFPRPKTQIQRRAPLWPETVGALLAAIEARPKSRDPALAKRVFVTIRGGSWEKPGEDNPISKALTTLCKDLGLHQIGRSFYSLRHTFQTVGDGSGQMVAVRYIMGHAPANDDMAARYREHTFEKNILIASDYVREWMFKPTLSCRVSLRGKPGAVFGSKARRPASSGKHPESPAKPGIVAEMPKRKPR